MLKPKPWWLFWLPSNVWITLNPNIYYPSIENPTEYPHLVAHEGVHIKQQESSNLLPWIFKYIFHKSFRFQMEVEAMATEAYVAGRTFGTVFADQRIKANADALAGSLYYWCAPNSQIAEAAIRTELAKLQ